MPPKAATSALIPRAKRNAAGEDTSRSVVPSKQRRPEANTTSKAIVLRHGRHGVWGEGQVGKFIKLSGQEKLALKAAELRTAVSPPFRLNELIKSAQAEMAEALDLISDLHDPDFFYEDISSLIASRPKLKPDLLTAPFLAKTISSRVHNVYLLAASWKIVSNVLASLKEGGLSDSNVRNYLKGNSVARDAYLVVLDTIDMLCNLAQQELSVAVVGSNELGGLFSGGNKNKTFSAIDPASVMAAHRSLIDAVIIELVLPNSRYEPYILSAVLRDALETTPREEAKKFSQNVFDALGNFVALVEMKDMLLGPLYEQDEWLKMPRKAAAGEIDEFFETIAQSLKASGKYDRWQARVYPLKKTKSPAQLEDLWRQVNTVYVDETGHSIDALWQLESERQAKPQYSTWFIPEEVAYGADIPSDSEDPKSFTLPNAERRRAEKKRKDKSALVRQKKRFRKPDGPRPRKAITQDEEDDGSEFEGMPGLMSVSESSDDEFLDESSSEEEEEEEEEEEDDESEWEGREAETMRFLLSQAMDYQRRGGKLPPWTDASEDLSKEVPNSMKANPFMKMLRSFAGRMFNPDPTFRPPKMGEKPVYGPPRPPPPAAATSTAPTPNKAPAAAATGNAEASKKQAPPGMTVEDADDEEEGGAEDKKKKKKKKKKPKKKTTAEEGAEIKDDLEALDVVSPVPEFTTTPATSPTPAPSTPVNPKSPVTSVKSPAGAKSPSSGNRLDPHGYGASTSSLPASIAPSVAQSAHSYRKEVDAKVKVKTRADPNAVKEKAEEQSKKGFFSKFTGKKGKPAEEPEEKKEKGEPKRGVFQLPKRASALVGRLLGSKEDEAKGKAPMKWDNFVKAMNLLGFTENKSSQGSRVTFYPPNPKDTPMVIHKPHPDPTISPILVKKIGKTLRKTYGWAPEHFETHLSAADAAYFDDDLY
ncbi:hypothetical protein M408DRAFT_332459 [Serendipita vermifera MAFF 305830]|uniref:Uncharacterized protein n=1 Tax=Serendipita vermifera MAFF 305830 TaxID=933852 RepID=A0A0C3ATC5_SERVB|nr:hypothetical protein M408DRAFT_332459 [Serendipita vermifera MAFF 305830]